MTNLTVSIKETSKYSKTQASSVCWRNTDVDNFIIESSWERVAMIHEVELPWNNFCSNRLTVISDESRRQRALNTGNVSFPEIRYGGAG